MKSKKQKKTVVSLIIGGLLGLAIILCTPFILGPIAYGLDAQIRMDSGISSATEKVLTAHCNCEKVEQFFLMQGFQYKKQESFGKRADFKIFNSTHTDKMAEMVRINTLLKEKVRCYELLDLVTFEFVNDTEHQIFTVQNGFINHKNIY
jgi:hypothetical protein